VSHFYGPRKALDDVSFKLAPGRFVALLGLNGAGKSTLFSLITRLYAVRSGSIRVFGQDIMHEPAAALRLLGIVFQPRTLDLDLSATQNLIYHAALHGIGVYEARKRAAELLAQAGLADRAGDKVRNFSGGQMRRIEIARALLHRPRLLILDEATVGLDIKARAEILDHVRMLVRRDGVTVVWATHLVDEVSTDDDLIVLHRGRVLAHGSAADIVRQRSDPDVAGAFTRLTRESELGEAA
jgi:ABC-2 type transport system ATP-binding protein